MKRALLAALLLLGAGPVSAGAQIPVDTLRPDTLPRDTVDFTALLLKSQAEARRLIPVLPRIGSDAVLPALSRLTIDRDSLLWHNAETVGDLLTKVPGVFLYRGGWAGRAELPAWQARGGAAVEYLVDGFPWLPLGQDSTMVDPSLLPLSFFARMEVERLPGLLRVHLYSHRNDRSVPYSRIGIASGDLQIARYQGQLEKRTAKGLGFAAAFDHLSVPTFRGSSGDYANTQGYFRLEYVPSSRFGAELRYLTGAPDREATLRELDPKDTVSLARRGSRQDLTARVFWARRADRSGPRVDLLLSRSRWTDEIQMDSTMVLTEVLDDGGRPVKTDTTWDVSRHRQSITQAGLVAGYRWAAASLEGSLLHASTRTPLELRLRGGLAPLARSAASLEVVYRSHDGGRTSRWLAARAGVTLPLGLAVSGSWRRGRMVAEPALRADSAQDVDDRALAAAWKSARLEVEATYSWNAGWRPAGYGQFPLLGAAAPSGRTEWLTVSARVAPLQWVILDGWYSTPQGRRPEGQPPTHSVVNGTIQSKFLPTFRSGIFNLKLQMSMENWSPGVVGRDGNGDPVSLKGATFFRGYIGLQLGAFTAYYDRYNVQGTRLDVSPGNRIPRFISTFGVRWEFQN